ncbi:MAG: sigma 54-interacting transcriptional regulator [Bradymonadaceae bacterium]|nr:sigma 54-interacting transcriptional regulator [Lujinxingiaceae bacterium]
MQQKPTSSTSIPNEAGSEALGRRLIVDSTARRVFVVEGLPSAQMQREIASLRQELARQGALLFCIEATATAGANGHLYDAVQEYLSSVEQSGRLSAQSRELFEFLSVSLHDPFPSQGSEWCRLYRDGVSRLWASLSQVVPAVLIVLNADRLPAADLGNLTHLMRYFYADPIDALTPEAGSWERARGSVVLVGAGSAQLVPAEIGHEVIALSGDAEDAVRDFLGREDVIMRFVASTGGDLQRLGELVETLPSGVEQFWLHRYRRLDLAQMHLIDVLACAGDALGADRLHSALETLGGADYFARWLNVLTKEGFVRRTVGSGVVLLSLENADFATLVAGGLDAERRCAIHLALAEAELACNAHAPSSAFLARHFLAAGWAKEGLEHGMRAVQQHVQRRGFEAAELLLVQLREVASLPQDLHAIHAQLAEIYAALGNHRKALCHFGHLKRFVQDGAERIELLCRIGQLLVQIGECESAVRLFGLASALLEGEEASLLGVDLMIGTGEAHYALGRHAQADTCAQLARDAIEALRAQAGVDVARADASLLRARNLLGKVAIFEARYSVATGYFQENDQLATAWGWEREMARAQANLGVVQLQQRNYTEAHSRLTRALELARVPGSLPRAYCLLNLGIVHQRQARLDDALDHYLEALRAARQSGDTVAYSISAHNLATLYQDMGAYGRALTILEHLEASNQGARHAFIGRWTELLRGNVLLEQERHLEALEVFVTVSANDAGLRDIVYGAEATLRSAEAHIALGQNDDARALIEGFELPLLQVDEPQLGALLDLCRGQIALAQGQLVEAEALCASAAQSLLKLGMYRDSLRARLLLAQMLVGQGLVEKAGVLLQQELQGVQSRAERVPAALRADFYAVGLYRNLVDQVQRLNGEVPAAFAIAEVVTIVGGLGVPAAIEAPRDAAFIKWRSRYEAIVGEDPRLHQIFRFVDRVASSDTMVLITGESGTGKELIAEALHQHAARSSRPFIRVNCAAFVESLLLSELFGHEKGAFTGAHSSKQGRFEMADGGTLFLDEIGDISPNTQVALLRVLQEGTFERVGGIETRRVAVRVVCATNKNLDEMVKRGEFRLDLYYRLKGLVLEMPALRERRADIPRLLTHFAERYSQGDQPRRFSRDAMRFLCAYSWSGNIRELENFVKSILLFVEGELVEMAHILEFKEFFADGEVDLSLPEIAYDFGSDVICAASATPAPKLTPGLADSEIDAEEALVNHIVAEGLSLTKLKKRLELECIKRALEETDGNITRAADLLQMKRPRLSQIINSSPELMNYKADLVG